MKAPSQPDAAKRPRVRTWAAIGLAGLGLAALLASGCGQVGSEVVVYAAQDRLYAEPLLRRFEEETGLRVRAVYDSEAVKTVGLAQRLLAERDHPAADLFWGNEEMRTRQLAARGVFDPVDGFRAFGWRSRRVVVNSNHVALAEAPRSLLELTNAVWRGRVALAFPLFGSTATHFAALRQHWGDDLWEAWCRGLVANQPMVVDGNSVVARLVARGEAWIGLTDSDDVRVVQREGAPVAMLPLNEESLLLPNTLGIVRGGPNPEGARRLADFLTRPDIVESLVEAGALEGADPATATAPGLQPDWDRLLAQLEDTNQRLRAWFVH